MLTDYYQPTIVPVLLIVLAGWFILRDDTERANRRFLLFLLGAGVCLLLAVFLTFPGNDEPYNRFALELPVTVMPALIGLFVLVLLNLKRLKGMHPRARVIATMLMLAILILLGVLWNSRLQVSIIVLPGVFVLFLIWSLGRRFGWVPEILGLIALGTLLVFSQTMGQGKPVPSWGSALFGLLFFLGPIFLVVVPALFLTQGLQQASADRPDPSQRFSRSRSTLRLLLAFLMFATLTYAAFWAGVWDQTMDLGFGFMFSPFGSFAALVSGLVMSLTLRGKYRIAGLIYMLLVPSLLLRTYDGGHGTSHHALTEQRAEQIARALQQFRAREGRYPDSLDALMPRDLLYIPQPIILLGEQWCYRGAQDFYQLAAIYREYWSLPLSLRIYASAGGELTHGGGIETLAVLAHDPELIHLDQAGEPTRPEGAEELDAMRRSREVYGYITDVTELAEQGWYGNPAWADTERAAGFATTVADEIAVAVRSILKMRRGET